ncbi:hypothetical protein [Flavobacterium alvei]|uniref:hypothetical protein n=1 Tax=Flavobacterium alvei TaxID=2080416 RepID=UPI001FAFFD9D|nr:hypothetical protein [Flavobacterium alvei]
MLTCPVEVLITGTGAPPIVAAGVVTVRFTWSIVTLVPFSVSFPFPLLFKTLPAFAFPLAPSMSMNLSSCAIITNVGGGAGAVTVMVTVPESQLVGFSFSQIE